MIFVCVLVLSDFVRVCFQHVEEGEKKRTIEKKKEEGKRRREEQWKEGKAKDDIRSDRWPS